MKNTAIWIWLALSLSGPTASAGVMGAPTGANAAASRPTPFGAVSASWAGAFQDFFSRGVNRELEVLQDAYARIPEDPRMLAPLEAALFMSPEQFKAQPRDLQLHLMGMALKRARGLIAEKAREFKIAALGTRERAVLEKAVEEMGYVQAALALYSSPSEAEKFGSAYREAQEKLAQLRSSEIERQIKEEAAAIGAKALDSAAGEVPSPKPAGPAAPQDAQGWAYSMAEALLKRLSRDPYYLSDERAVGKRLVKLAIEETEDAEIQRMIARGLAAHLHGMMEDISFSDKTELAVDLQGMMRRIPDEGVQRIITRALVEEMLGVGVSAESYEDRRQKSYYRQTLILILESIAAQSAFDAVKEIVIQGLTHDAHRAYARYGDEYGDAAEAALAAAARLAVASQSKRVKDLAAALILREINVYGSNPSHIQEMVDQIAVSAGGLERLEVPALPLTAKRAVREHGIAALSGLGVLAGAVIGMGALGYPPVLMVLFGLGLAYVVLQGLKADHPYAALAQLLLVGGFLAGLVLAHVPLTFYKGAMPLIILMGGVSGAVAVANFKKHTPGNGLIQNAILLAAGFLGCLSLS